MEALLAAEVAWLAHECAQAAHARRVFSDRALQGSASGAYAWLTKGTGMVIGATPAERPDLLLARSRRQLAEVWGAPDSPRPEAPSVRSAAFERMPRIKVLLASKATPTTSAQSTT